MQEWLLNKQINNSDDIEFINGCGIKYSVNDPLIIDNNDSGWRDASTGYSIPTPTMRVVFDVSSKRDLLSLKLKYGDMLKALTIIAYPGLPD